MTPIFLDCDTGIDDALAVLLLLRSSAVELVGASTVAGNIDAARAARNTLDLLHLAGRDDVPVAVGAADPLAGAFDGGAAFVHGADGVGGVRLPTSPRSVAEVDGPDLLLAAARAHAGRLHVVATGPLTNLALALQRDPGLAELVAEVTVMGGAALAPGNISPVVEANVGNDPEAAAAVLAAPWRVTVVPLDVTLEHLLTEEDRARLAAAPDPAVRAVGHMLPTYFAYNATIFGRPCAPMHDAVAAGVAVGAAKVRTAPRVPVSVDTTGGPGRGQLIADLRGRYRGYPDVDGANVRVVLDLAAPFAPVLLDHLLAEA